METVTLSYSKSLKLKHISQLYKYNDKLADIKNVENHHNDSWQALNSASENRVAEPIGEKPTGFKYTVGHEHEFIRFTEELGNVS